MIRSRWTSLRALGCCALALLVLAAGCGLSADDEPRTISDLPADLVEPPSTTTTLEGTTTAVTVYLLVRDGDTTRLAPSRREVEDANLPGRRIDALLQPLSRQEEEQSLISSIPTETVLLGTELIEDDQELIVDLSGALFDIEGRQLAQAFAQIVWTVTEMEGVRRVRFRVDGEQYRAPNAEGIEQSGAVTTADYRSLAPK